MNSSTVVYTPPRPNLGPEAFDSPALPAFWLIAGAMLLIATAFGLYRVVRPFMRKNKPRTTSSLGNRSDALDLSPEAALLDLVGKVRESLAAQFGEGIRARTTEELMADPRLAESLGAEAHSDLIEFLRLTDVARFAGSDRGHSQRLLEAWSAWAVGFLDAAGARSTISGK